MTARIREFLKKRRESGQDEGPCLVVDLDVVRTNYQNFAKALPDTRVFYAVKANPAPGGARAAGRARLLLRHRLGRRDRDGAGGRRDARPHLLRQHHQEGARHRPRLRARRAALRRRLQGRGREDRPRRARLAGVLPHPVRLRRRRMAAVAQVRLRARHGRGRAGARPPARARGLRHLLPRRLAADQPARLGPGAGVGRRRVPRVRRARAERCRWSTSAAASRPST